MREQKSYAAKFQTETLPKVRQQIIDLALEERELSPRELAVRFTDEKSYFVSEASVYRLLKAQDLITSPAFIVIKAAITLPAQEPIMP